MRIDEILADREPVFSFEFFPPRTPEGVETLFETVEALKPLEPSFVSVTYGAGGATRDGTVEIATRIKQRARPGDDGAPELRRRDHARAWSRSSTGFEAAGIDNVLALRGDPPRGEAEFKRPEGGLRLRRRAGRPSSPSATSSRSAAPASRRSIPRPPSLEADLAYLKTKVDAGASFLITQLFFDNRVYFDFVDAARAAGIEVPIIPGVIPIASYAQIVRFCELCAGLDPAAARRGDGGARGRPGRRGRARHRLRGAPVRGAAGGRRAGHPLLHAQQGARRRAPCSARCESRGRGSGRRAADLARLRPRRAGLE